MAKNPNTKKPRERLQTKRRTDEDRPGSAARSETISERRKGEGQLVGVDAVAVAPSPRLRRAVSGASEVVRYRGACTSHLSVHGRFEARVLEIELEIQLGALDYP